MIFRIFSYSFHFYPLIPHVDAELFGDEADDVGREHLHVGLHAHRLEFLQEGLAPTHQGLRGDARALGQLLFRHCFHNNPNL